MTTDVLDSTNVNSLQPLSSFNLNAEHNGVQCIESLNPEDKGTERQFWFTRQMLREIFDVKSDNTITNHVEALINRGVIEVVKNLTTSEIPTNSGIQKATLYDLKVFNYLVMRLDTDRAWEMKAKFNDVLVKAETQTVPKVLPNFSNPAEAARAWADQYERAEAARNALEAEQEAHEQDNRDYSEGLSILESKKAEIGSRREAKAMATASAKSRECARLAEENDELKDAVGRGANWRTVSMMKAEWVKEFGHTPVWQKLKQFSQDVCIDPVKDVEERVILKDGSEKVTIVNRYHREAWARYRKYEENLRVTDTEIFGV